MNRRLSPGGAWRAKAILADFQHADVSTVLSELGFQKVEITSRTRFGKHHDWCFKGLREDELQLIHAPVQWDPDSDPKELVVIREAARRGPKPVQVTPIRAQRHITFGDCLGAAKTGNRGGRSRRAAKGSTADAKVAASEPEGPRRPKRVSPGDDGEIQMPVDQEDDVTVWAPLARG